MVGSQDEFHRWADPAAICGIPQDSEHFDESGISAAPELGEEIVLARFELPPQYCGVLDYFAQFTDLHARRPAEIETPGFDWSIRASGSPLAPYLRFDRILNPWGQGSYPVAIRLNESTTLEFVVRRVHSTRGVARNVIRKVGGRILGRYWYNTIFGDKERGRYKW